MTIHFTPGDANTPLGSHHQAIWRDHEITAYGSGNNLIIFSISGKTRKSLQTIYLSEDLAGVSVNAKNGHIAICSGTTVTIFRPLNEYMRVPKWTETARFDPDGSRALCLQWVPSECELAIGTKSALFLYYASAEYGQFEHTLKWHTPQPGPVESIDITADGSKLVSYTNTDFSSYAKVWSRLSYGESSLFDLSYASHESDRYLVFFKWRKRPETSKTANFSGALENMSHIKNIRSFMPALAADENDILYTVTDDHVMHVWATCDFNGHSYLKKWANFDMRRFCTEYVSFLLLDGENARFLSNFVRHIDEAHVTSEGKVTMDLTSDFLLVIGRKQSHIVRILHVTQNPPNNITFEKVCSFDTDPICIPRNYVNDTEEGLPTRGNGTEIDVTRFLTETFPIASTDVMIFEPNSINFLVHDRSKNTLRRVALKIHKNGLPKLKLKGKFQGHGKSVKKLYTSSSSHEGNIMLSVSSFPHHNYLWEPLMLPSNETDANDTEEAMAITKRFRLNVTRDTSANLHEQGIENAVLLNDIYPASGTVRHHLAVVYEKGGFLSVWDCDGATMDDQDTALVKRLETIATHDPRIPTPSAFFSKAVSETTFVVVAIYDTCNIEGWKIDICPKNDASSGKCASIVCQKIDTDPLPGSFSGMARISAVETFLEKDVTLIDEAGVLRSVSVNFDETNKKLFWKEFSLIETNIKNASAVSGASLIGKIALVNAAKNKLSIWDSRSGVLEFEETFPPEYGPVKDLDWTFLGAIGSTASPLLGVGFSRFVLVYTQLRYDYTNKVSTFVALKKIDISDFSSHEIGDSIWLDDSYLVISSGNQFFIDDRWVNLENSDSSSIKNSLVSSTLSELLVGYQTGHSKYLVSDLVRILNGPLPVYHPQFLIQALLMDKSDLVRAIVVKLLQTLRSNAKIAWNLNLEIVDLMTATAGENTQKKDVFETSVQKGDIFDSFNSSVTELLSEKLTLVSLPLLTRHQQTTLRNLVIIMSKLAPLRKSLDSNGMKFLYGFELFKSSHKQKKLTIRDINWAMHSDQKEMLFSFVEQHYRRITWGHVTETGLAFWVDVHRLKNLMESAARNEFADERDPAGRVSVLYLAIQKKQVLLGLWRTVLHTEKDKVLKFLSNNFNEPRWSSAALKNAFVLLGKHRYMDAAYFFLLAGKVKDCCMTLCRNLQEIDLALAVARVNADEDAIKIIFEQYILPEAVTRGDRWTTSWAFWELKLKEVSIQALVMPPIEVVTNNIDIFSDGFKTNLKNLEIRTKSKSFLTVDPALGVLYSKLRTSKSFYLQGSKAVSPEAEFDFVATLAHIYMRMGCDYLSLLLLRDWEFLHHTSPSETTESTGSNAIFSEFSRKPKVQKIAPEPSTFQEPDMSAFSFGF